MQLCLHFLERCTLHPRASNELVLLFFNDKQVLMTLFSLSFSATFLFSPGGITGSHPSPGTGHTMSSMGKAIFHYCSFSTLFPNSLFIDGVSSLDSDEQRVHSKHLFQWFWGWFRDQCPITFPLLKGLQCCFNTHYETQTLTKKRISSLLGSAKTPFFSLLLNY